MAELPPGVWVDPQGRLRDPSGRFFSGGASTSGEERIRRNIKIVADAIRKGAMAGAVEAACRVIVQESKRRDRPLAWDDVTGNLRSSISFQVENHVGPKPLLPLPARLSEAGKTYNAVEYRSGENQAAGVYGVVFAPPEYAVFVEAKSSRSVLIEPMATVKDKLFREMGSAARRAWEKLVFEAGVRGMAT